MVDRWCVTKLCAKLLCVKDDGWQMVCDKVVCEVIVCERWWLTDGVWQSCVWSLLCVKDGVWQRLCDEAEEAEEAEEEEKSSIKI
jgi:hypothetical protein